MWAVGVIFYILLCGYAPFQASKTSVLMAKIKQGDYTLHEKYWKNVSAKAKDFVQKLLVLDTSKRLTAEKALRHPWMLESASNLNKYEKDKDALKTFRRFALFSHFFLSFIFSHTSRFNAKRKLLAYVRAIMLVHRMKKLCNTRSADALNTVTLEENIQNPIRNNK